jgi:hypothetical protein
MPTPTYLPARNGVAFSQAYAEAISIAPTTRVMLEALEFRHSAFLDATGVNFAVRIVNDYADLVATLEANAPANPGATVTFSACPISVQGPDETDTSQEPFIQLSIDGVSRILVQQLDYAIATLEPVLMTVRVYASDDTSGPAVLPVTTMTLREVRVLETRVTAKATFYDPTNKGFPRQEYTAAQYGGLSAR